MSEPNVWGLPRLLQVGPFQYRTQREPGLEAEEAWGKADNIRRLLLFGDNCHPTQLPTTFMHELLHAVESAYRVEISERDLHRLANGLTQALQSAGMWPERAVLEGEVK